MRETRRIKRIAYTQSLVKARVENNMASIDALLKVHLTKGKTKVIHDNIL